jgi:hypothetical protein
MSQREEFEKKLPIVGQRLQSSMVQVGNWPCCLNCDYWGARAKLDGKHRPEGAVGCGRANLAIPPPDVIVVGCEDWDPELPF